MNIILGSGVNALAAKHILGDDYTIIHAGLSRFYKFNPAPADNFVIVSDEIKSLTNYLEPIVGKAVADYKCAWSNSGSIIRGYDSNNSVSWLSKLFGVNIPMHFDLVLKHRMEFKVFSNRINQIYSALYDRHKESIDFDLNVEKISSIEPHKITMSDGRVIEYDKCISTIPLNDLNKLINYDLYLKAIDISVFRLSTTELNFEGFNQLWVTDPNIGFYKTQIVNENEYLFYFNYKIENPGSYINKFIGSFDLMTGIYFKEAIPAGQLPDLSYLKEYGIIPLGMSAQWDCAMDFSSCLLRIVQISDGKF